MLSVGDGFQDYRFISLATRVGSIITVHSHTVRLLVQILSRPEHPVVPRLRRRGNVRNILVFSGVLLLAEEAEHHEDCTWCLGRHVSLGAIAALAPVVFAASPFNISGKSPLGHHICLVGFSTLPIRLPDWLVLDVGDCQAYGSPGTTWRFCLVESVYRTVYQEWPCTFLRVGFAEYAATASSSRVDPQHNGLTLMAAPFPA